MANRGDDRLATNPFEEITWQKIQSCFRKFAVTASIKTDVRFAWLLPAFFYPLFLFLFFFLRQLNVTQHKIKFQFYPLDCLPVFLKDCALHTLSLMSAGKTGQRRPLPVP